jgi:diguanylate cyclase (GGDEF)-like protein
VRGIYDGTAHGTERAPAHRFGAVPVMARMWGAGVVLASIALAARTLPGTRLAPEGIVLGSALVACAVACCEEARRQGLPDGASRDLLTAWCLPVALLMPPACALFAPALVIIIRRFRARSPVMAMAFRAGTLGLAGASASFLFRSLAGGGQTHWFEHPASLAAAAVCGAVFAIINTGLTAVAARAADPLASWRQAAWDHGNLIFDLAGLCAGILVAIACSASPLLLAVALPPVLLLQHSLPHEQLRAAARTDPKTGLLHAMAWQAEAGARVREAGQDGAQLALLLADIDHFKWVNDVHGHLAGDQVLLAVVAALCEQFGDRDLVGRFGGEEFVVLAPGTGLAEAAMMAERVRERVAGEPIETGAGPVWVTVSIGVAALPEHGDEVFELLAAADHALYRAKEAGRDRVCWLSPGRWPVAGAPPRGLRQQ